MRTSIFSTIVILFMGMMLYAAPGFSQQQKELPATIETEFKVLGVCGMCKDRIEKAAYSVRGVKKASWDQKAQKLQVAYRTKHTDQETVERAIAQVGHDTQNFITDEKTYANLHGCCIYPRDPEMLKNNKLFNQK